MATNELNTATTYQMMNDTFQSFTGAEIQAIMTYKDATGPKQKVIGTLSSITVSVVREVNPLWSMGSPDYRAISKGKRSISGTMTFVVLDRDPIVRDILGTQEALLQLNTQYTRASSQNINGTYVGSWGALDNPDSAANRSTVGSAIRNLYNLIGKQPLRYADQMAPFDITISLINDQGAASVAAVRQINFVSQGTGWSMHDLESDQVYSYIARYYEPLQTLAQDIERTSATWNVSTSASTLRQG